MASRLSFRHLLRLDSASSSVKARSRVTERSIPTSRAAISKSCRTVRLTVRLGESEPQWRRNMKPPWDAQKLAHAHQQVVGAGAAGMAGNVILGGSLAQLSTLE